MPRFLPTLPRTVLPTERYHVAPRIGAARAEGRIQEEICEGTFRPPDAAEHSSIEEAYALFVPFFRIEIQRSDSAIGFLQLQVGSVDVPVPHRHASEAKATWMVSARTAFPYEMKHPSTLLPGDAKPLTLSRAALAPGEPPTAGGWEVLDADVDEARAKAIAASSLARPSSSSARGLFPTSEVTVHALHFVRYPIWFARYRYRGEASDGNDLFYIGISAVDGAPITAAHPSKLRAGAAKVRRFFRFED